MLSSGGEFFPSWFWLPYLNFSNSRGSTALKRFGIAGGARERKFDEEAAAFSHDAFHLHVRAMCGANGFDDGKPQPRTAFVARAGFVYAEETLKHVRHGVHRNSDSA